MSMRSKFTHDGGDVHLSKDFRCFKKPEDGAAPGVDCKR